MRIGIFGGSFNPVHYGHLEAAKQALNALDLAELWLMPAAENGMKKRGQYLSGELRKRLLETALRDTASTQMKLSTLELDRGGVSYTYDTYMELRKLYPQDDFYFIYGSDCLNTIEKWYQSRFLLEHLQLCFLRRAGYNSVEEEHQLKYLSNQYGGNLTLLECSLPDISSSMVRNLCKNKQDISGLVPQSVEALIYDEGLYCNE